MSEYWKKLIPRYYDLGEITRVTGNHRGYSHAGFTIETMRQGRKRRHFLKSYRPGTSVARIRFVHALLERLDQAGFRLSPRHVLSEGGKSWESVTYPGPAGPEQRHIAIYGFLPGEDKYDWDDPVSSEDELRDAAMVLAAYHAAISGWRVPGGWNGPNALEIVPRVMEKWCQLASDAGETAFDRLFQDHAGVLLDHLAPFSGSSRLAEYNRLPKIVIHGDFHPGNLKYADGKVTAVLDFDLANTDARLLDLALALVCFCDAENFDNHAEIFLDAYDRTSATSDGIRPLNPRERAFLPEMISLSNLLVVNWVVESFHAGTDGDSLTWLRRRIDLATRGRA